LNPELEKTQKIKHQLRKRLRNYSSVGYFKWFCFYINQYLNV